jgi:hypothetical protein
LSFPHALSRSAGRTTIQKLGPVCVRRTGRLDLGVHWLGVTGFSFLQIDNRQILKIAKFPDLHSGKVTENGGIGFALDV